MTNGFLDAQEIKVKTMKNRTDATVVWEQKMQACDEFLSTTRCLKKALASGEEAAVVHLIKRRDDLIRLIDELDRLMVRSPHPGFLDERSAITGPTEKPSEILGERLRKIMSVNQECETMASAACEKVRKELAGIHRKEEGLQGYHPRHRTPKFLNIHT